jgi:integrase
MLCETLSEPIPHINFEQRIISVKNKPRKPTKNGRERHIRINQDTYDVLLDLRRRASNPAGTLFQLPDGSSWVRHRRIVQREFGQCVKAAGLHCADRTQNVTIHTLRHTFASWLALKGVPLRRVQYLMGHNSIETTERYAHLCAQETYEDTEVLQGVAKKWR